ncbi:rhodanese-like domain-containing protein [Alcaligenaceae bacterium]|nr:rhodanese-like domain-containing protein [Alcaligenaceae bacterium]
MDFFLDQNNLLILAVAATSGFMLLLPMLGKARGGKTVDVQEAVRLVNHSQGVFLDIRSPEHFKAGTIPQARNIPVADIATKMSSLPKDKPIIIVCDQGNAATGVATTLRKEGYTEAVVLEGGLRAWLRDGMPLSKK